ncbi:MAG: RNA-binding protein [Phycisphaera sp.]|nr:RNA-binding protein [Phycisphaera sp.]
MKIYVGNLSFKSTEDDIRDLFGQHGNVEEVAIITDRETGRSRGFAFVTMSDSGEANAAIEAINGMEVGGRALTVNEARPRTGGPGGGGGGGGYRGGGSGGYRGGGDRGGDRGGNRW